MWKRFLAKMEIIGNARASAELRRLGYDLNKIRELAKQTEERQRRIDSLSLQSKQTKSAG
jgi:hypothetical protein